MPPTERASAARGSGAQGLGTTAARGTGVTVAGQAYSLVIQTVSVVVLARLISPGDFGLVAAVVAVIGVSDLFRDFGLSAATMRAKHLTKEEQDNLFWLNTAFGVIATVVVAACAPLIGMLYDNPRIPGVVVVLSLSFTINGMTTQFNADLIRRLRFTAVTLIRVIASTGALAAAIILALMGASYWALIAQRLVILLLMMLFSIVFAGWIPGRPHRHTSVRHYLRFGAALFGTQVLTYASANVDNIGIGVAWGSVPLGYYDRSYRLLVTPLTQINAPMLEIALPTLSRAHEDHATFERYTLRAQLVGGYVLATMFALAAGLSPSLILLLLGRGWGPVVPIFAVLAIGGVFRSTAQIAYWVFLAANRSSAQLKMSLIISPVMVACILAGLPWGPIGVATGSTIAYFGQWVISLVWAARVALIDPRKLLWNISRVILAISMPCGVLGWAMGLLGWSPLETVLSGFVSSAMYLGLMYLALSWVRQDLRIVVQFALKALGLRGR